MDIDIRFRSRSARLAGHVVAAGCRQPGVLFVHGWDSDGRHQLDLSHRLAALGCTCLSFDLRGHGESSGRQDDVSRDDSLADVLTAHDALLDLPSVDGNAIALIGTSYGGYLAALATLRRTVHWLALRVPALYGDDDWLLPKEALDRDRLMALRRDPGPPQGNRLLSACRAFEGDALVVESGDDRVVLHSGVQAVADAFTRARSVTHRCIEGADHALSDAAWQDTYAELLVRWFEARVSARDAGRSASGPDAA